MILNDQFILLMYSRITLEVLLSLLIIEHIFKSLTRSKMNHHNQERRHLILFVESQNWLLFESDIYTLWFQVFLTCNQQYLNAILYLYLEEYFSNVGSILTVILPSLVQIIHLFQFSSFKSLFVSAEYFSCFR